MAYGTIAVEGGIFPGDLLDRIGTGQAVGQRAADFGLDGSRRLSDETQGAFSDARSYWDAFQRRLQHSRESPTTITRESWIVPLLERLGFALALQRSSAVVGGESYFLSHRAGADPDAPPVHVVAIGQDLDRRAEATRRSPHALVQEYLNRSDALWGIVTNGEELRLLRDSARVAHPAYVEFNLRAMVEGNVYSEFVLLYRLIHRSRLPEGAADAHTCRLEQYYQQGIEEGGRVRDHLRDGVEAALRELGAALIEHPASHALRGALSVGHLDAIGYYRQLLRLVYRLLFLFVAEERRLIFPPDAARADRQWIYTVHYSASRLRDRCERYFAADTYADLWAGMIEALRLFRNERATQVGLAPLDGELFGAGACPDLETASCENHRLLRAIWHLSTFADGNVRRRVNYAWLDVEELGSVYESLLDYRPEISLSPRPPLPAAGEGERALPSPPSGGRAGEGGALSRFDLVAGSERRQTGSYYTPPHFVQELIQHALVPVMDERLATAKTPIEKETALLGLRVCDPAAGSGHFLLAAARRIGRDLARVRTGEDEPTPSEYRRAVRDVIRQCIYAVDRNPLAVDLCKVALWIESHAAGLPLSFLDHHVKCGDSLVGVGDLGALAKGIPDEAYTATAGDDRRAATYYKRRNKEERTQHSLDAFGVVPESPSTLAPDFRELASLDERTPADVAAKKELYESLRAQGTKWYTDKIACDLWTAAFFTPLHLPEGFAPDVVPTTDTVRRYLAQPAAAHGQLVGQAVAIATQHPFFHWPLEFADVFAQGGFDAVLGNPPFMGGKNISPNLGEDYFNYLTAVFEPAGGLSDLCAYVFRRAFDVLRPNGHMGMVATKTISQGDSREGSLAVILDQAGSIISARRFIKWPGVANVEVNLVGIRKGAWLGPRRLDGKSVSFISSRLDEEPEAEPKVLRQNSGLSYQGSIIWGIGFVLEPQEAEHLMARDARNRDCLFPYLTGEDLNSRPDQSPSRWVINFFDWGLDRAETYPDLMNIVLDRVKPGRDKVKRDRNRMNWWLYGENRPGMHRAIAPLRRVLVRSEVSELHMLSFVPKDMVYSHMLVVFAFDDGYHCALLQSNVHEAWVRRNASTMRTDIRYTPTACFETFPFPQAPAEEHVNWAGYLGDTYHERRRRIMLARNLGLTKTYNLFHKPECRDDDIQELRGLHADMDRAILACYGWDDLGAGHGFHANERGQTRYTVSPEARREILRRLLELNLSVAAAERAAISR
ncbi:MAG: hypothetical protein HY331_13105 [Chloroflexi bacterium]|nr:hypothetical protein [Chloroflexota bacterium]